MLQAYVGIVSSQGLELFVAEHPDTVRFLWRRKKYLRGKSLCFWCVVADDAVGVVLDSLQAGYRQLALELLNRVAHEAGRLFPGDCLDDRRTPTRRKA